MRPEIEKEWVCPRGHRIVHYKNSINQIYPFSLSFPDYPPGLETKALCPYCLVEILNKNIPEMKEVKNEARDDKT